MTSKRNTVKKILGAAYKNSLIKALSIWSRFQKLASIGLFQH